jgi:hypothetical protein
MARNKKYKAGDTYLKKVKGTEYIMEVQEVGRAKVVGRSTPYKNKDKANTMSKVPATAGKVKKVKSTVPTKKKVTSDQVINGINPLNNNKHIYIRENDLTAPVYIERRPGPGNPIAIKRHTT